MAAQNTRNAKKQKCHHTMSRTSSIRCQQETSTQDRLQLWRLNMLHKDGSWTSKDAKEKWELACQILAASDLTPEDGNIEANERVFREVMGLEHPARARCRGFDMTPSKFYHQSSTSTDCSSTGASRHALFDERLRILENEIGEIKGMVSQMFEFMKRQAKKKTQSPSNDDEPTEDEDDKN